MAASRLSTRRSFIKSAPLAVAAISLPVACGVTAKSGMEHLLERFEVAHAEMEAASQACRVCAKVPGDPGLAQITRDDFSPRFRRWMPNELYLTRSSLQEFFTSVERAHELNRDFNDDAIVARWSAELRDESERIFALYDRRGAEFDQWEIASGLRAAEVAYDERCDVVGVIEDEIANYRCETIDEVRAKADWIIKRWAEDGDEPYYLKVLKSLATT
jgi:hypothetical protein